MMNRLATWMLVCTLGLGLIACSSDSSNNPTPDNSVYLPTTVGSSWVYTNTELSGDSANPVDGAVTVDSMYVSRTGLAIVGRTATEFVTVLEDGSEDTTYFSVDGSKIYQLYDLDVSGIAGLGDVSLGSKWVLMADINATAEWKSIDTTITNVPFDYNGTTMMGTISIKFTGKKVGAENVMVKGTSTATVRYLNVFNMTLSIDTGILGILTIPLNRPIDAWLAKNIGVVKTFTPPTTISVGPFGDIDVPGVRSELTSYTIK